MPQTVVAQPTQEEPTQEKKRAPSIASIDAAMQKFVDAGQISGAVTLVGHRGKIVHLGAVGMANIDSAQPMQRSKMFAIASMTKPITATAVMILVDEGKLDLDDPISKYLPAFDAVQLKDGVRPQRQISIRDAITHTAGFTGNQVFESSLADAADEIATRKLGFQPGTKWQYSPGLNVAGRIVEVVAKQPFEEFVNARILEPLQMQNTTFFPSEAQQKRIATIYKIGDDKTLTAVKNRISEPGNVTAPNPSGGLFANARDLLRFYQAILNGGQFRGKRIVSKQSVERMVTPQTGDLKTGFTPGNCWGLGWCIIREPQGVTERLSPGTFGHGGAFGTQGWVDPETKAIYVLLIQRNDIGNSDGSDIRRAFHQAAADAITH